MESKISAIILASGYSKRFLYGDKLLMEIKNKKICEYVFDVVSSVNFFETVVVYRDDKIGDKALEYGFKVLKNDNASNGISEAIKLGVMNTSDDTNAYIFFQADQIFITKEDIDDILTKFDKIVDIPVRFCTNDIVSFDKTLDLHVGFCTNDIVSFDKSPCSIVIPYCNEKEISPIIFPVSFKKELLELTGDRGGKSIIERDRNKVIHVYVHNEKLLLDIDTIDDFNKAKSMLE